MNQRLVTVHMDTSPLPIADDAGALAAPARSLWQNNAVGINLRFHASWALRDPRPLAWTTVTEW